MELKGDLCGGREMPVVSVYCKVDGVLLGSKSLPVPSQNFGQRPRSTHGMVLHGSIF
jgi:hypothetical protein